MAGSFEAAPPRQPRRRLQPRRRRPLSRRLRLSPLLRPNQNRSLTINYVSGSSACSSRRSTRNSVVSTLRQLGLSIPADFYVENDVQTWQNLLGEFRDLDLVKSYMAMKVRLMFDPPSSSFGLASMTEMVTELEWRINVLTDQPYSVPVLPSPEGSEV